MSSDEFNKLYDIILLNSNIFVFVKDHNIIGCITTIKEQKFIHNGSTYLHIEDLIIDPLYQGKGIGTKLIKYCILYGKQIKVRKIILNCSPKIKQFYLKNNFIHENIQMSFLITQ